MSQLRDGHRRNTGSLLREFARVSAAVALAWPSDAQRPPAQLDSAAILHRLHKLEVYGSVLYVAAHPDDENTRLISYLSNGRMVRTGYLSLTRGDGGQNLIGPELGAALGVLRTQELLEARRIDGGEQFFTRAVDFGYSKSPEETLAKWGREAVLGDVVRVVRTFRPDVIVTRFDTDGSGGHGHHTASALLAQEACELAADPNSYLEQLAEGLEPWRVQRLFFNAATWWNPKLAEIAAADPARWIAVDVGGYDALLGTSYTELAGRSRSQHKSQGFGAAETRGALIEYLRLERGPALTSPDLFDGLDTSWSRAAGSEAVRTALRRTIDGYDVRAPERSLPALAELASELDRLAAAAAEHRPWVERQSAAVRELALQTCGLAVEVSAPESRIAHGHAARVKPFALLRRPAPRVELLEFSGPSSIFWSPRQTLTSNQPAATELSLAAPGPIDGPYWLEEPYRDLYGRAGGRARGIEPVLPSAWAFRARLRLAGTLDVEVVCGAMHTWVDRVAGERTRAMATTPVASVEPRDGVVVARGERAEAEVEIEALCDGLSGRLVARSPPGWSLETAELPIEGLQRGKRLSWKVGLKRGSAAQAGALRFAFEGPSARADRTLHVIDYDHILPQIWYAPAEVRLVPLDLAIDVKRVGYVPGAGDEVAQALTRLGVAVERIDPAAVGDAELDRLDAIVTGIRAYNTVPALARLQPRLLAYVERGGTLVVQYNTIGSDLLLDARSIGPRPFALTRQRVTLEDAPPTFLQPDHHLLNVPNRIGMADFEDWVQERGLYFAGELDAAYAAPIAWCDPGEAPLSGGLIACDHGQGRFIYTGLSLFRQLPAGVPGAYRLLANLIARRSPRQ
jgi:LmbE family N-acetylglucosaminyl deacetylase